MKAIKTLLFFGFGFFLTVILFELILRFGGILSPAVKIDPKRGERYYPNKWCCSIFVAEGFGLAKTNAAGWFGKEFVDKGSQHISVAVIGNSFVAARQIFYRDHFLNIAEQEINRKHLNKEVSFYNFGKEDLPLKRQLFLKEEIVSGYHPDYLLLLINNESFDYGAQRYEPYYDLANDGSLRLDTSFKQLSFVKNFTKLHPLTESSVLFLANRVKNHLPETKEILFDKFYPSTKSADIIDVGMFYKINPVDEVILRELAKDKRIIFMLDLNMEMADKVKSLIASSPVIELKQPLDNLKKQGIDPNFWAVSNQVGHWNHAGHKLVGTEIAKGICNIIK